MSRSNNRVECTTCLETKELCDMTYFKCCNNGACNNCKETFWSGKTNKHCLICNSIIEHNQQNNNDNRYTCCVWRKGIKCEESVNKVHNGHWFCENHYGLLIGDIINEHKTKYNILDTFNKKCFNWGAGFCLSTIILSICLLIEIVRLYY